MIGFILGEKSVQSQTFNEKGERIPTTLINTSPCYLIDIKTPTTHGYGCVQIGFKKTRQMPHSEKGKILKAGVKDPLRFLREFRVNDESVQFSQEEGKKAITIGDKKFTVGQEIKPVDMFKVGEIVAVSGISKGKGFQGVVARHGFKGGPKTHGQSDRERAPGAIGMTTTPGRVFKGKRMAGRTGGERVTVGGLIVVEVSDSMLKVNGLVPGAKNGLLEVRKGGVIIK